MSKAFTDEEAADASVVGRPMQRAARGHERPMTPEGHQALVAQLQHLHEVERPALRATGGLDLEHRLRELDHRVALLTAQLESVRVVVPPLPDGLVRFGSVVTLRWASGREQQIRLVGPDEVDTRAGRISVDSPLAKALLGHAVGDEVEIDRPRGAEVATVVDVS